MEIQVIKSYIAEYKRHFDNIHSQEIYKWHAIKQFRENFNIEAEDFYNNMEISLSKAKNLLDSGQYFPKRMLLRNLEQSPEQIREMFRILFDEDFDLLDRIENFRNDFKTLNKVNFNDKNDYQDHRAIIVYLTLHYPERYFFYKFNMFKNFAEKVDFTYQPTMGKIENVGQYQNLCELVRYELEQDQELLNLHEKRLDSNCYRDRNYNVLTQDFIYAVDRHLDYIETISRLHAPQFVSQNVHSSDLSSESESVDFTPRTINHIQNTIENKRTGDLGELWVYKNEKEYLKRNGQIKLAEKVKHVAKEKGDGLGYDILSFDLEGNKKYIEVKTTKGNLNSIFYVSRNELERSIKEQNNYFLYRVFNYKEDSDSAELLISQGELSELCRIPVNYKVKLSI